MSASFHTELRQTLSMQLSANHWTLVHSTALVGSTGGFVTPLQIGTIGGISIGAFIAGFAGRVISLELLVHFLGTSTLSRLIFRRAVAIDIARIGISRLCFPIILVAPRPSAAFFSFVDFAVFPDINIAVSIFGDHTLMIVRRD